MEISLREHHAARYVADLERIQDLAACLLLYHDIPAVIDSFAIPRPALIVHAKDGYPLYLKVGVFRFWICSPKTLFGEVGYSDDAKEAAEKIAKVLEAL